MQACIALTRHAITPRRTHKTHHEASGRTPAVPAGSWSRWAAVCLFLQEQQQRPASLLLDYMPSKNLFLSLTPDSAACGSCSAVAGADSSDKQEPQAPAPPKSLQERGAGGGHGGGGHGGGGGHSHGSGGGGHSHGIGGGGHSHGGSSWGGGGHSHGGSSWSGGSYNHGGHGGGSWGNNWNGGYGGRRRSYYSDSWRGTRYYAPTPVYVPNPVYVPTPSYSGTDSGWYYTDNSCECNDVHWDDCYQSECASMMDGSSSSSSTTTTTTYTPVTDANTWTISIGRKLRSQQQQGEQQHCRRRLTPPRTCLMQALGVQADLTGRLIKALSSNKQSVMCCVCSPACVSCLQPQGSWRPPTRHIHAPMW